MSNETEDDEIARHDTAPWVAGESLGGIRGVWLEGDYDNPICLIGDRPDAGEVAALIAAAPDLLAACLRFRRWDSDPHATEADAAELRGAIDAAIARAGGAAP